MNDAQPPSLSAMIAGELAANLPTETAIKFTCDNIMPIIQKWLEEEGRGHHPKISNHLSLLAAKVQCQSRELSSFVDRSLTL
jgi:hypothetical protein